jgi:hypothetical protein
MKVFGGYRDCGVKVNGMAFPDSWHQYGTGGSTGFDRQQPYSSMVCPGFWRADSGVRLARDIARFERQVQQMVTDNDNFQLIITFNEWGEGTAVEPAKQWGNDYLDVLRKYF